MTVSSDFGYAKELANVQKLRFQIGYGDRKTVLYDSYVSKNRYNIQIATECHGIRPASIPYNFRKGP